LVGDTKVFAMLAQSLQKVDRESSLPPSFSDQFQTKTVDVLSWDDYMERLE
jgi:hypothetical protein